MDKRGGQEGLFRNTIRWAMANNSHGEDKSGGGKKLLNSSKSVGHSQMKQADSGSGGQKVAAVAANGGKKLKRNTGGFRIKRENNQESDGEDKKGTGDLQSSDHAKHLWTEKKRRKKMKNMFQELHDLLPKQTPKAKLLTIVDDAVSYITYLQQILQKLETQKLERFSSPSTNTSVTSLIHPHKQIAESFLANGSSSIGPSHNTSCPNFGQFSFPLHSKPGFQTWASSNVVLNVCGPDAHINICCSKKPGLLTAICTVLEKCKLDIISADISSDDYKSMFMIHARVSKISFFLPITLYIYNLVILDYQNKRRWLNIPQFPKFSTYPCENINREENTDLIT
ncbi:putative transcription factor bHLH family [Helianthus anomalus]